MKNGTNILIPMAMAVLYWSTDEFSKAFDCIDHQLVIAKLNAYGVDTNSLYLLASSLEKRKQKIKVNDCYIYFDDTFSSVPQGSILVPLLFNLHICDLLFRFGDLDIASHLMIMHHPLALQSLTFHWKNSKVKR